MFWFEIPLETEVECCSGCREKTKPVALGPATPEPLPPTRPFTDEFVVLATVEVVPRAAVAGGGGGAN